MRVGVCVFFSITLIIIAVITAGCSSIPLFNSPQQTPPDKIDIGFSSQDFVPIHTLYTFEDVKKRLSETVFDDGNYLPEIIPGDRQVLYIRWMHIDRNGSADNCKLVIRHGNRTYLVTYDKYGETITHWNASHRFQAIPLESVISPIELFNRNHAIIFGEGAGADSEELILELTGGNYTLQISGRDRTQFRKFDAITGVLTGSND